MQWASALSKKSNINKAVLELKTSLLETLGKQPDLIFVFVSPDYHLHYNQLPEIFKAHFPKAVCMGCSALGVIAEGQELEDRTAIAVMAACLPEVQVQSLTLATAEDQLKLLELCQQQENVQIMLLSDPVSFEHELFLARLNELPNPPQIIGGLASGSAEIGYNALFANDCVLKSGAVAVLLTGNIVLDQIVFQGARPIADPMFVTSASGNIVTELDGLPAQIILFELLAKLQAEHQQELQHGLLLGVEVKDANATKSEYSLRNILAVDTEAGCLILDHAVTEHAVVCFHLRDPELVKQSIAKHFKSYKKNLGEQMPEGALLFTCVSKGAAYYQQKSCETKLLKKYFSKLPIGGFFSAGEYGRINGKSLVQGHSSSFCFFRAAY